MSSGNEPGTTVTGDGEADRAAGAERPGAVSGRRSRDVTIGLLGVAALAFTTTGCASQPQRVYCVDDRNQVVNETRCDNSEVRTGTIVGAAGAGYFLNRGPHRSNVPVGAQLSGGDRVGADDPQGRQRIGAPTRGAVGNGTSVRSGGFGSGRSGGGSSGRSGSGSSGG